FDTPEVSSLPSILRAANPAAHIRGRLAVEQVRGTELLGIKMTGENPEDMAVIVNSLLKVYLRLRDDKKRESDEKILRSLRVEQAELEARLQARNIELRQLAVESGLSTSDSPETALNSWVAELHQVLTQAHRDSVLAAAKLEALDASDGTDELVQTDPTGFEAYLQNDLERRDIKERLRLLELAGLDDERLGRGASHPDVAGRPQHIAALREDLSAREAKLRELYKVSLRRRLRAERLDAEITAKVIQDELDRLTRQRAEAARQTFILEDFHHERERLEQALMRVRQQIWNVDIEQNRMARVTIDSPALAPKEPNLDKRIKYTVAACLMSLLMGTGAALVRHRLDTSLRDPEEITDRLGMTLLGSVQRVPNTNGIGLVGDARILEPLRGISTALLASSHTGQRHSRLITSPTAQSGKSSMAVNLARTLASTGRHVLLMDADNSGQGVTRAFEIAGHPGLKELLEGTCRREQVVHQSDLEDLQILPAGQHDERFGEYLARQRAQEVLRSLFEVYDEVIVDSPPVLVSSNAVVLATLVDEVVLVLRAGKSTREEARAARRCLAGVGSKLVGVILNAVDPKKSPYSYYRYPYVGKRGERET
ncbi:MAG: polysaccharide biosynthesis tyrosine autokinase, partial [Phycisphaerae bacterium]